MNLTTHVREMEEFLSAASAAGDEPTRRAAELLLVALEPAARLALMNALAELADEVSVELGDRTVEIRLDAGEARAVVSAPSEDDGAPGPELAEPSGGESSRITLRLPEQLKVKAEEAAAAQGSSLNTWLVQTVRDAVRAGAPAHGGHRHTPRVRGWVQS
jgi:predicted HicB family RNase H-like nuclease